MKPDDRTVSVRSANGSERSLIENLTQFYIYDFSEMEPPRSSDMELGDEGCFSQLQDLDSYWRVAGFHPLLIRVDERLAGFALINTRSRCGEKVDHSMAEFFAARKHRRRGVATQAVRQVLAQLSRSLGGRRGRTQCGGQGLLAPCDRGRADGFSACSPRRRRQALDRADLEFQGG
jgi:predicted acetyltransferase